MDEQDRPSAAQQKRRKVAKALLSKRSEASVLAAEHGLTVQQAVYVDERAKGVSPTASAAAAGYSNPSYRILSLEVNPSITEALAAERTKNALIVGYTRREVLEGIAEAIDQAKTLADPMAQIAGWREVAKICGYYAPEVKKIELTHQHKRKLSELEQLSDQELLEIALKPALDAEFTEVPPETAQ